MVFEEKLIYFPEKYPKGAYDQARSIPNLRDCWVTTEDGVKLHAWFAPAESAQATLLLSHGNGGNISYRYLLMRSLQRRRFNVLMYDYRGYGRSEGTPTENGIYTDGRAFFDYLLTQPEVDQRKIVLWGTSLGGAVATDLATHRPAAGLILESTFTSGQDVARILYPLLPTLFSSLSRHSCTASSTPWRKSRHSISLCSSCMGTWTRSCLSGWDVSSLLRQTIQRSFTKSPVHGTMTRFLSGATSISTGLLTSCNDPSTRPRLAEHLRNTSSAGTYRITIAFPMYLNGFEPSSGVAVMM